MEKADSVKFTGERAEYFAENVEYENCVFSGGESPLKHGKNISADKSSFEYKYPLWNAENVSVRDSVFHELGKSGLWYTKDVTIENTVIEAPKEFRRSRGIFLKDVSFTDAKETMWSCRGIRLENVQAKGDYFAMNSSGFYAENFTLEGNYLLDGGRDIEIRNSRIISKDAFWNCENVTVYDSLISGEYLGWNSRNLKFVNCTIESDQGLCYVEGLTLENCVLSGTDLAFEYSSSINAKIKGGVSSVKNPCGGRIEADEIGMLILNPERCDIGATEIVCPRILEKFSGDPNRNENKYPGKPGRIPDIAL